MINWIYGQLQPATEGPRFLGLTPYPNLANLTEHSNIENMIRIEIVLTLPYSEANISLLVLSHPSVIKNCLEHPNLNAVMDGMG